MFKCIDTTNSIVDIKDYCLISKIKESPYDAFCPFCNNSLIVKAINSQEKTHFAHKPKQSCSYKSYEEFFKSSGHSKTQEEITEFKKSIIKNLYIIFMKLQSDFIPTLNTTLFLKIMRKVAEPKILKLRNINYTHIPYIWLNELGKFENKVYLYTNSEKLDLSKFQFNIPPLWNTTDKKDIIITAEETSDNSILRTITPVDLNFSNNTVQMPTKFLANITRLQIFNIFSLEASDSENLLKELLNMDK